MIERRFGLRQFVLLLVALLAAPVIALAQGGVPQKLEPTPLTITSGETVHRFTVEVADDREERGMGLMFRREMAPDAGMIFDYFEPTMIAMWMRNTYIPLDMLFIDGSGTIRRIAERTVPFSESTVSSGVLVKAVLELNGGTADRLGIEVGDTVQHAIFGNAPE